MIPETTLGDRHGNGTTSVYDDSMSKQRTTTIKFYVAERNILKFKTNDITIEYALNDLVSTRCNVHRTCLTVDFL